MKTAESVREETRPHTSATATQMKALVYHGPGQRAWEDKPRPAIQETGDAIVGITTATICGTDLHILKGDVPSVTDGRRPRSRRHRRRRGRGEWRVERPPGRPRPHLLYHVVRHLRLLQERDVLHCRSGGWILGTPESVRVPHADTSLYVLPAGGDEDALVMLSDILPTGFECGVLNGQPGDTVAIVGAGPIGLAALLTAQFYAPAAVLMIDVDENRLRVAQGFGATTVINSADGRAVERVLAATEGAGVDVAIEAVGVPATFDICQSILAPGGRLANVGVHGKPVTLHMEKLWDRNITLTTRLVDTITTGLLLKTVQSGKLQPGKLVTHRFALADVMKAYDTFGNAAKEGALKVVLKNARP